jgi:hypothetical protein
MERVLSDGVTRSQAQCFIDQTTIREDLTYSASLLSLHGLASARMRRQRSASFTASVSVPAPEAINCGSCVELSYIRHVVVKAWPALPPSPRTDTALINRICSIARGA